MSPQLEPARRPPRVGAHPDRHPVTHPADGQELSTLGDQAVGLGGRLKLLFALLSCLGGIVLGTSPETEALPVIAVFFAAFGFLFVDTLKWFALPAPVAYGGMGLAAAYCVLNFTDLDRPGNPQIVAVAELLVMVQGILMLQEKNRRIFEQLGVFCLLQLVVAAVFSDAIYYGLLLLPIGVIGLLALASLATLVSVQPRDPDTPSPGDIRCGARPDPRDRTVPAHGKAWAGLVGVVPAVALIGVVFFYVLPRSMEAPAAGRSGSVMVGFSDQVRLEQFGQMLQSDEVALRIRLTDRLTGGDYLAVGDLYLRGRVLERYLTEMDSGRPTARWESVPLGRVTGSRRIPPEFTPARRAERNLYDRVVATITCESMRSPSLFTLAPHYSVGDDAELVHEVDRWTIRRRQSDLEGTVWNFPRIRYQLGTNAFRGGTQTELLGRYPRWGEASISPSPGPRSEGEPLRALIQAPGETAYTRELLRIDTDPLPALVRQAEEVVETIRPELRSAHRIARSLEQWLKFHSDLRYSLNLDQDPIPGMDPTEQFLTIDRKGHCQLFASALVLMLRSQGIPARMVVGYRTDEYSELGKSYVARQYHAHAWVEALIDAEDLPTGTIVPGQPPAGRYWLRLDPTPVGGPTAAIDPLRVGGVRQIFDLARHWWDDYVVEMDQGRQRDAVRTATGVTPMTESYGEMIRGVRQVLGLLRAGPWWDRLPMGGILFSWPAAIAAMTIAVIAAALLHVPIYRWIRRQTAPRGEERAAIPGQAFYAETLRQLGRLGWQRRRGETPVEFVTLAAAAIRRDHRADLAVPLGRLTESFYRRRFRPAEDTPASADDRLIDTQLEDLTLAVDRIARPGEPGTPT